MGRVYDPSGNRQMTEIERQAYLASQMTSILTSHYYENCLKTGTEIDFNIPALHAIEFAKSTILVLDKFMASEADSEQSMADKLKSSIIQ